MIKVALLDDNKEARVELKHYLENYEIQKKVEFKISEFDSGFDFLDNVKDGFNVAFLDIDMPAINGLDVARRLRNIDKNIVIIFVTNMAGCAINGYEVDASDFLVKPINKTQIEFCLDRCLSKINNVSFKKITIKSREGYVSLRDIDVTYVEVSKHSLIFHTENADYETYGSLKELETSLDENKFVRCNSCYLVNLDFVQKVDGDDCVLNNATLPISRSKKKNFIEKFLKNI